MLRTGSGRDDAIKDKCGIFGVWGSPNAAGLAYVASIMQQHRGEAGAGIVTSGPDGFHQQHGPGLVKDVFTKADVANLGGTSAIAHVRYPTSGPQTDANLQPFMGYTGGETIALAHNGEFANHQSVKARLEQNGAVFSRTSDSEIPIHTFFASRETEIEKRVADAFATLQPAYSIVMLTRNELIGLRDPNGVRPLVLGKLEGNIFALASETVAFDKIRAKYVGEVNPGEMILINNNGMRRIQLFSPGQKLSCIFEHIYFGRQDSLQFGSKYPNSEIRKEFGRQLYREHPVKADLVSPVPDSGIPAALGFSQESIKSGNPIEYDENGLVRSHYIGRTFIHPTQEDRDAKVEMKFNPNRALIRGKRIVLVDDSIVRGTSMRKIVEMVREAGAAEVHLRISSPQYVHGCYLGIDTPEKSKLIAYQLGLTERIRSYLKADSLGYLSQRGMLENGKLPQGGFCTFCFDGIERISRK